MTSTDAWTRDGSCWHDGPDRCPGCRHCADHYTEPDDTTTLPRWLLNQHLPDPWEQEVGR